MYIADFHIHSKYSRATSKNMEIPELARWAKYKGINLLGTGDITHFLWFHELTNLFKETDREGIYQYGGIDFILTGEACNIFDEKGKVKKIHNILFLSSFAGADKLNRVLERYGDINADGRPILQMEAKELVKIVKDADEKGFVVPAHIWTPHFSLFGSNSGFDSIQECFGDMASEIFALETGLSSDPAMNWMVSSLDRFSFISNSDAHSAAKIGREANIFGGKFDLPGLKNILKSKDGGKFLSTVEYFPEEGKYHFDGHRNCNLCLSPEETRKNNNLCPVCGRKVTIGVMNRVCELSDRKYGEKPDRFIPFKKLVPLDQIIGSILGKKPDSVLVRNKYKEIIERFGTELSVLLEIPEEEMYGKIDENIIEGIRAVRKGRVKIVPGYDGEFGKVEIPLGNRVSENEQTLF
ncbi:MAG: DNA helicase UvrD [Candidatus Omnitrophica bacterium]|nr:DNA helicase UvrD [Candidatus Omnitrophota bacterium]